MSIEKTCRDIVDACDGTVPEIGCDALLAAHKAGEELPVIIDLRPEAERAAEGAIPFALHIPTEQLAGAAYEIAETDADLDKPVIIHCRSGKRSLTGAQILKQSGFRCALSLAGGINEWKSLGGPVG